MPGSFIEMQQRSRGSSAGLSETMRHETGHRIDKLEQCSNWDRRPLRECQLRYCAVDAYALLVLHDARVSALISVT